MTESALWAEELDPELSQGDVFRPTWDIDLPERAGPVIVISHGCDIEKNAFPLVADVVLASGTDVSSLGHLKKHRVWHGLWLVGLPEMDAWVNLRTIRPFRRDIMQDRLKYRIASMTEDGRMALSAKLFSFVSRTVPS